MEQRTLIEGEGGEVASAHRTGRQKPSAAEPQSAPPRIVAACREQLELQPVDLDSLIPPEHRARAVWRLVEQLDLRRFYAPIKARGSTAGRSTTDPKVLLALWL